MEYYFVVTIDVFPLLKKNLFCYYAYHDDSFAVFIQITESHKCLLVNS